ncbi:hypothetical protein [Acrocarpospora sp. B8E8]|uniref:hypothetical protein n=1 Tax=Acrocarpospora sp. B8E8 TaxID=3153572 RepID=UPI00325EE7C9
MKFLGKIVLALGFSIAASGVMVLAQTSVANAVVVNPDPNWCDHRIKDLDMPEPETYPNGVPVGDKCPAF